MLVAAVFVLVPSALAQDLFEIQVYPYETVKPGSTMVEFHMNFIPSGTRNTAGGAFANHHQFHLTMEVTHGLSESWELGWYLVSAFVPNEGPQFAGARIRPRFRIPERYHWPFGFSVSTEIGFNKHRFEEDTITLEIRPIIEKEFGKWYFSVNPDLTQALRGPGRRDGLGFEPGVKLSYDLTKVLAPGFEYYAETGPIKHILPGSQQHHLMFATLDVNTSPKWEFNFGVGRGMTAGSEQWIVKWIIGR